jgi:hypothetical protein
MAMLSGIVDILVGSSYSPAIAIALIIVLLLIIMWLFAVDSKVYNLTKWLGIASVLGYLGLGYMHKKIKAASPEGMLSSVVAEVS